MVLRVFMHYTFIYIKTVEWILEIIHFDNHIVIYGPYISSKPNGAEISAALYVFAVCHLSGFFVIVKV